MIKRLLTFIVLLHAAALPVFAKPLPTNFVQTISLNLSFVGTNKSLASGASTVSNAVVTSKTAIAAFGTALGRKFSAKAQFLELIPITYYTNGASITGYGGTPTFVVVDGTQSYDVTSFFTFTTVNDLVNPIASATVNKAGAFTTYVSYRIRTVSISQGPITFSAQGFVKTPTLFLHPAPNVLIYAWDDNWTSVTGVGTLGNEYGIVQGTINATYLKLE